MQDDQLLTREEVAEWLRISQHRLYKLMREEGLPYIPVGYRDIRFSRKAIEQWLRERQKGGTSL